MKKRSTRSIAHPERENVGKIASDLLEKKEGPIDVVEQRRAMQEKYIDNLIECAYSNKSVFTGDFFIVVETKTEPLIPNVARNYFFARQTCPTPTYDESVYRYIREDDKIEYLWTLPSKEACYYLRDHAVETHPEQRQLLLFVLSFFDGTLLQRCQELNHEQPNSILLEVH